MKISVVTVCFNSAETIRETLDSFFGQEYPSKEIFVIDGGSTDGTLELIKDYSVDYLRVISEPDNGIYDAMNKGLRAFTGDAVGFLNSDDRFRDCRCLSLIADRLQNADIVYGDLDFVEDHRTRRVVRQWRSSNFYRGAFRTGWMPAHPTFYVRREVVNAVGEFDLQFGSSADYDFMLRAMELHSFQSARIKPVLVNMMHGGKSTSSLWQHVRSGYQKSHLSRRLRLGVSRFDPAVVLKPARKLGQLLPK